MWSVNNWLLSSGATTLISSVVSRYLSLILMIEFWSTWIWIDWSLTNGCVRLDANDETFTSIGMNPVVNSSLSFASLIGWHWGIWRCFQVSASIILELDVIQFNHRSGCWTLHHIYRISIESCVGMILGSVSLLQSSFATSEIKPVWSLATIAFPFILSRWFFSSIKFLLNVLFEMYRIELQCSNQVSSRGRVQSKLTPKRSVFIFNYRFFSLSSK